MKTRTRRAAIAACAAGALLAMPMSALADPADATAPDEATSVETATSAETAAGDSEEPAEAAEESPEAVAAPEETGASEAVAAPEADAAPAPAGTIVTLDLYNLTDVHGHIEQVKDKKKETVVEAGLPAMNCYLKKARTTNPNSSFTLLGDNIGASPFTSGSLKDNPTIAALNTLSPLASTIGNHELDMGQAVFKQRVDGTNPDEFVQVGFPYLGANIEGMGSWSNGGVQTPYLGDYKVWESPSGVKVAFIGAIAEDVPYKLSPGTTEGLTFSDPLAKIDTLAKSIKDSGEAQIVIAMLDDDVKNNYPKVSEHVDGLMGGDTHVPYEFDHVDSAEKLDSKNPLLAGVASGSYTDNLGLIRISYDTAAKKVVSADTQLIPAAKVAECGTDPATQAVVDKAVADSKVAGEKVIAEGIPSSFYRGVFETVDGKKDAGSNRGIESSLGDLIANAMRDKVMTTAGKHVDIGIINAGGIRADLTPGEDGKITYKMSYDTMPFSNEVGYVTLTGADFKQALEEQWKTNLSSQNSRPLLKLGISDNVRYTYDATKPAGSRITSVTVDGKPLDPAASYTVGSVTFLLDGGDSFESLTKGGKPVTLGRLDREMFNEYLAEHPGVAPRALKSSIGITLPKGPVKDGEAVTVALRGLSFSEGPSITKKVGVTIGGERAQAEVDNSLVEAHASDEASVITTDGAGRAEASVVVSGSCKDKAAGEVVAVPVVVETDFGTVVEASQGLSIDVQCAGTAADPQAPAGPAAPAQDQPQKKGQKGPGAKALAKTGASVDAAALLALVLVGGAATALGIRKN
ncbi:bifunctional metallophosphatase/5'-nucleotidase [Actinomyces sp. B33]|uniref:bifunctional metallophosphatase/5'-nucleotidase n=1 Tax=Actinomyces sp. B33 TaxID=2942131 RepID=UPI00233F9173|nr:bifunctional UDP-sugar hydrolase/5'-nucleotidase [Actinomyces sp. B33]MDC4233650.1 bifunctional metallophosphatase/5'-nucleotidase [Actinomyces sp. B33]